MARVFPFEALRYETRERQRKVKEVKAPARSAEEWVRDFYPRIWPRVETCHAVYTPYESVTRPGTFKVSPKSCRKVPWCVVCARNNGLARCFAAMDRIAQGTPKGKPKRVVPWTLSAPVYDDGTGVGMAASNDLNRFAMAARRFLHDTYGAEEGELGGLMSYQDFGEKAFAKRNPHWHITLNGYLWRDGRMMPIERLHRNALPRMRRRWDETLAAFFPGAKEGNSRIEEPAVGRGNYFKWLKYETRELVDLRKVEYDPGTRTLWWKSYHSGHERVEFKAWEFRAGLDEYLARVEPHKARRVHREWGYLHHKAIGHVAEDIGGSKEPHHETRCPCRECDDWFGLPELRGVAMGEETMERKWTPSEPVPA